MSQKQFAEIMSDRESSGWALSVSEAAHLLARSERQVQRLKRRLQPDSTDWLIHGISRVSVLVRTTLHFALIVCLALLFIASGA